MKASIISIISLAVAVAALPPSETLYKKGGPMSISKAGDQCQEGKVSCCAPEDQIEDKSLLSLLNGFNLLGFDAVCSPIEVLGHINLSLLGSIDDAKGNVDCKHTLACCTGASCHALGE
ncbi:hypothetical protein PENANT_c008G01443 [Penicillium antarcticum]|uniref:Hydrophobin n=1 Tax=Penicillium antarcticum TaxID=416450 RepID=A0A1V6QBS3_9EURO|nr:uncharacterized protein N7508_007063 [Penicillium antarcticum]KAJ5302200.1 hypothetical protein N7508_007063 [Penicillium antarcticum]OQD86306.1 hypothetical protein PENANT_c008G01443 [Penicillium antarcticum]